MTTADAIYAAETFDPLAFLMAGGFDALAADTMDAIHAEQAAEAHAAKAVRADLDPTADHKSCPRCAGTGKLQHFRHVSNGDCFRCMGRGRVLCF